MIPLHCVYGYGCRVHYTVEGWKYPVLAPPPPVVMELKPEIPDTEFMGRPRQIHCGPGAHLPASGTTWPLWY
jgi:hypothetical protein